MSNSKILKLKSILICLNFSINVFSLAPKFTHWLTQQPRVGLMAWWLEQTVLDLEFAFPVKDASEHSCICSKPVLRRPKSLKRKNQTLQDTYVQFWGDWEMHRPEGHGQIQT